MSLIKVLQAQEPEVDLTRTYDAIVIGSGAAGGVAAHVLTSQGLKVLLLEAGKKLDIDKELKSMQWPYEHPRRGGMPPDRAVLTQIARNEIKPEKPEEEFFVELKSRVAWAYYTTEIGIKEELEYKGNTFQADFAGYD